MTVNMYGQLVAHPAKLDLFNTMSPNTSANNSGLFLDLAQEQALQNAQFNMDYFGLSPFPNLEEIPPELMMAQSASSSSSNSSATSPFHFGFPGAETMLFQDIAMVQATSAAGETAPTGRSGTVSPQALVNSGKDTKIKSEGSATSEVSNQDRKSYLSPQKSRRAETQNAGCNGAANTRPSQFNTHQTRSSEVRASRHERKQVYTQMLSDSESEEASEDESQTSTRHAKNRDPLRDATTEHLMMLMENPDLSVKERRQLRNKISARNFRLRKKEYIKSLEFEVAVLKRERDDLMARVRNLERALAAKQ